MAKKRVTDTMEPAPDGSRVLVYRREPAPGDLYRVSAWHGMPHFECNLCPFDTLVAGNLLAHLDSHAGSEPVKDAGDASADLSITNNLEVEDDAYSSEE